MKAKCFSPKNRNKSCITTVNISFLYYTGGSNHCNETRTKKNKDYLDQKKNKKTVFTDCRIIFIDDPMKLTKKSAKNI